MFILHHPMSIKKSERKVYRRKTNDILVLYNRKKESICGVKKIRLENMVSRNYFRLQADTQVCIFPLFLSRLFFGFLSQQEYSGYLTNFIIWKSSTWDAFPTRVHFFPYYIYHLSLIHKYLSITLKLINQTIFSVPSGTVKKFNWIIDLTETIKSFAKWNVLLFRKSFFGGYSNY